MSSGYERDDMQCCAVDDGVQCDRGVRNIKRMLCNKHNSRWQRNGSLETFTKYKSEETREQHRMKARQRREDQIKKLWSSLQCLCIHTHAEHQVKGGCLIEGCLCGSFSGASVDAIKQMINRMSNMGFIKPINNTAYCVHCQAYVDIGKWYHGNVVNRMREHLKSHQICSKALPRLGATG